MEIWKDVPQFEGKYQVSSLGRVRSVSRVIKQISKGGRFYELNKIGKILRPGLNAQGYPTVVLGREHGTATVHSLVLLAFCGPAPLLNECRHKNGKRNDPRLENLEYGTRAQNIQDAIKHGTWNRRYDKSRKITVNQIPEIRRSYFSENKSFRTLAVEFKVSYTVIRKIIQRRGTYAVS